MSSVLSPPRPAGGAPTLPAARLWGLLESAFPEEATAAKARVACLRGAELPDAPVGGSGAPPTPLPPFHASPAALLRATRAVWATLNLPPDLLDVRAIQAGDAAAVDRVAFFLRACGAAGAGAAATVSPSPAPAATAAAVAPGGKASPVPWWQVAGLGKVSPSSPTTAAAAAAAAATIPAVWPGARRPEVWVEAGGGEQPAAAAAPVADEAAPAPRPSSPPSTDAAASASPDTRARSITISIAARLAESRADLLSALAAASPGAGAAAAAGVLMKLQFALADAQADLARAAVGGE
jgi:hypothetical protein